MPLLCVNFADGHQKSLWKKDFLKPVPGSKKTSNLINRIFTMSNTSKIQAVILAGGQGSRLRPYTTILPKPLMPVGELPIAEIIIRQLKRHGLTRIAIATGHLSGLIQSFFGDGRRWGVNIQYIFEDQPLGTAGALKLVEDPEDNFLVMNGDILTDVNFRELFGFHKKKKA